MTRFVWSEEIWQGEGRGRNHQWEAFGSNSAWVGSTMLPTDANLDEAVGVDTIDCDKWGVEDDNDGGGGYDMMVLGQDVAWRGVTHNAPQAAGRHSY